MNKRQAIESLMNIKSNFEFQTKERTYTSNGKQKKFQPSAEAIKFNQAKMVQIDEIIDFLFSL